jgi:hypothetical protein
MLRMLAFLIGSLLEGRRRSDLSSREAHLTAHLALTHRSSKSIGYYPDRAGQLLKN